jgi:hypothetical protein
MKKKIKKYAEGGAPTSQPKQAQSQGQINNNSKYTPSSRLASMGRRELAAVKAKGQTTGTMSNELLREIMSGQQHPAFQLATKLYDKFPKRFGAKNTVGEVKYKKGGKVKKAKCRDGIAIRGKTKGTIR